MIVIICAKYKKNPSQTVDATEQTRFSKSRPNDLEDTGQGQGSSHATHPLMLLIICTKYGKNPSWTVDATGRTWKVNGQTDGQTGWIQYTPPPNFVAGGIKINERCTSCPTMDLDELHWLHPVGFVVGPPCPWFINHKCNLDKATVYSWGILLSQNFLQKVNYFELETLWNTRLAWHYFQNTEHTKHGFQFQPKCSWYSCLLTQWSLVDAAVILNYL